MIVLVGLFVGYFLGICVKCLPKIDVYNVCQWYEELFSDLVEYLPKVKKKGVLGWQVECDSCESSVSRRSLIPFVGGWCSKCANPKCPMFGVVRWPVLELLTGCLFFLLVPPQVESFTFVPVLALFCALIVAAFIDIKHYYVPTVLLCVSVVAAFGVLLLEHQQHLEQHFLMFVSAIVLLNLCNIGKVRLGFADIVIVAALLLFMEVMAVAVVCWLAAFVGLVQFLYCKVRGVGVDRIAFVPALLVGLSLEYFFKVSRYVSF